MFCKKSDFVVLAIVVVCVWCYPCQGSEDEFQKIDPNSVPGELMRLSTLTRENYEKIKTWQGKMNYHAVWAYRGSEVADRLKEAGVKPAEWPEDLEKIYDATIDFKVDLQNDLYFKHFNRPGPVLYVDPVKDRDHTPSSDNSYADTNHEFTTIVTPGNRIEVSINTRTKDRVVSGRTARKQLAPSHRELDDPRVFFNVGSPVWQLLSQLGQSLANPTKGVATYGVVLEKKETAGSAVSYRVKMSSPGKSHAVVTCILSGDVGFNPVYVELRDVNDGNLVLFKTTVEFATVQDVFVPKKLHQLQFDRVDGKLKRDVEYEITEMQINVAIPEDAFSVQKCGLFDGDRFIDEIAKKEYTYKLDSGCFVDKNDSKKYKHTVTGGFVGMTE